MILFIQFFFRKLKVCVYWYLYLHACLRDVCLPGTFGWKNRVFDSIELSLQMVLSHYVGTEYRTQVLWNRRNLSSPWSPCFWPCIKFLLWQNSMENKWVVAGVRRKVALRVVGELKKANESSSVPTGFFCILVMGMNTHTYMCDHTTQCKTLVHM